MACSGDFRLHRDGDQAKKVFTPSGTDFAVDVDSISSEWTSESDKDPPTPRTSNFDVVGSQEPVYKQKRKRIRVWRVKHSLAKHRHLCDDSSSSRSSTSSDESDSSSTSSGSETASDGEQLEKGKKRQHRNERRMASLVHWVEFERKVPWDPVSFSPLQWTPGDKNYRQLAFAWGFLTSEDIRALHRAAADPSVNEIHDRKASLAYKHRVVRFEMQLRALYPDLYSRLMALMRLADVQGWKKLRKKKNRVYPEVEYIEYDVAREGGECYIEPHVDNKAGITLIAMLSQSSDYMGGNNCFRRVSGNLGHRQTRLEAGDVCMFRGEKLLHWITNVSAGRRVILQIELSRV